MMARGSKILLVEDDENDVFLIKRAFRRLDLPHTLEVVGDGEAAINFLQGKETDIDTTNFTLPELILLDLKLPRLSGLEVLQWIRQQPDLKRMPVVILTASRETPDINRAYDLGVNSYLVKPVNFNDFLAMLSSLDSYWLNFNEKPLLQVNS